MGLPLEGRVAVVTGAGVRVGRAIAEDLGRRGAAVVVHYAHSAEGAEQAAEVIRAAGARVEVVQADLAEPAQTERLFEAAERLGGCDLLVNSAAIFEKKPLESISDADWQRMLAINLSGPFYCCRAAVRSMRRKGRGDIVNLADVGGGLRAWRGYAHYCASKAGVAMLTQCLALELAPIVRVNAIAPGTVLFPESFGEAERQRVLDRIPLGRAGTPDDVLAALRFLVEGSQFITGQLIALDGGRSLA